MPQSLTTNLVHLIFSTKNRTPCLSPEIRPLLFSYMAGVFHDWNSPAFLIGGHSDHVHALFNLSKNYPLCKVVEEVKKSTSKWMKNQGTAFNEFYWQNGYGAFSVSQSHVPRVSSYIGEQEQHHQTTSYQEEFRRFLKRYLLEFDERYVWD